MKEESKAARILWAIRNMAEHYNCLALRDGGAPPFLETFLTGASVIEKTLEQNGIEDPDMTALLGVLLMTAKHFLEPMVDHESIEGYQPGGGEVWRKKFLSVVDVTGGVSAFIFALDQANKFAVMTAISEPGNA